MFGVASFWCSGRGRGWRLAGSGAVEVFAVGALAFWCYGLSFGVFGVEAG